MIFFPSSGCVYHLQDAVKSMQKRNFHPGCQIPTINFENYGFQMTAYDESVFTSMLTLMLGIYPNGNKKVRVLNDTLHEQN
jgi:hypothetical protein